MNHGFFRLKVSIANVQTHLRCSAQHQVKSPVQDAILQEA